MISSSLNITCLSSMSWFLTAENGRLAMMTTGMSVPEVSKLGLGAVHTAHSPEMNAKERVEDQASKKSKLKGKEGRQRHRSMKAEFIKCNK